MIDLFVPFVCRDGDVDVGPSRADTSDDWGRNRAALPAEPPRGSAFGERRSGGGFADRDGFRDRYVQARQDVHGSRLPSCSMTAL